MQHRAVEVPMMEHMPQRLDIRERKHLNAGELCHSIQTGGLAVEVRKSVEAKAEEEVWVIAAVVDSLIWRQPPGSTRPGKTTIVQR